MSNEKNETTVADGAFDVSSLNPEQQKKFLEHIAPLANEAMQRYRAMAVQYMSLGDFMMKELSNVGDEDIFPKLYTALEQSHKFHEMLTNYLETLHCMSVKAVGLGLAHINIPEPIKNEEKKDTGEFKFNMKLTKE